MDDNFNQDKLREELIKELKETTNKLVEAISKYEKYLEENRNNPNKLNFNDYLKEILEY